MWLKVEVDKVGYEPDLELEDLDFEYCLPKGFWLNSEWYRYQMKRRELLSEIKGTLRLDELYLQSLEFR